LSLSLKGCHIRHINKKYLPKLHADSTTINLVTAAFLVCFVNGSFWHTVSTKLGLATAGQWLFLIITGLSLWMVFNILLSIFSFKPVYKPFLVVLFCVAAMKRI